MALFLGIDLGTSYFKAGLFDRRGTLRGLGRVAVATSTPAPGRFELPAPTFWELLRQAVGAALREAGVAPGEIAGLSYSSQASTFLLLDDHDRPLTPLISWRDTRGEGPEPALAAFSEGDRFQEKIGFRGLTSHSAVSKWRWFQRHEPALWQRARRVMTMSDYFTYALTGERRGDAGTAAFLGLYDLQLREWWPAALSAFAIEARTLSMPLPPGSPCAQTTAIAATLLGLPSGIPFAVGSLDHHVGAIGAGLGLWADTSITTGTVLAAMALVEGVRDRSGCFHGAHTDGLRCYRLAFDAAGAGCLEEYQRRRAPALSLEALLEQAKHEDGKGPGGHGQAVRRMLEEIAQTHRALVQRVSSGAEGGNILATGGGARSALWLQIKADALGRPLVTSQSPEQGCLGAAIFAAVAAREFAAIAEAQTAMTRRGETYGPRGG